MDAELSAPKVLLFGAGSIGGVYLYQLLQAGCKVTAVCRSNHAHVKKHGFNLTSVRFGNVQYRPHNVVQKVTECANERFDFIVVCTKSFPKSVPSLADMLKPVLEGRPQTAVVLAQNGILIEEEFAEVYPPNPILSGVVYCPAVQTGPGNIDYPDMLSNLQLGTFPADSPAEHKAAADAFVQLMIKGGGGAEHHSDIQVARWSKLMMNAAWNPISALTLCTDGDFLSVSGSFGFELAWGIMMEVVELASKFGVQGVTMDVAERLFGIAKERAKKGTGREMSMLQDVRFKRRFEVEAIVGNAVRLARELGLKLVRMEAMYALLLARHDSLMREAKN